MEHIRVLIVDDSFFMRKIIIDMLQLDPAIEVVGEAVNGEQALQKIAALQPQVVTLDIEMPEMNGLEALRKIVALQNPPAVIMVSGYTEAGADITLECLTIGAVDFVHKPSGSFSLDLDTVGDQLLQKVKAAPQINAAALLAPAKPDQKTWQYSETDGVVVVGASTGGPLALETILPAFPANFPCPIVVAQHLPKEFTKTFLNRLQKKCSLRVLLAEDATSLEARTIYIVAGGTNTTIVRRGDRAVFVVDKNLKDIETPSISKLMVSAAAAYKEKTIGVIMTGMGTDGSAGMEQIKLQGGRTLVQDKATSAVFGMGQEVTAMGLADQTVALGRIAETVSALLGRHG
ncbi:MAG TPA: chemotaxis-specific protein-glutamate methyltransferase CheB [Candidatus Saccharimonadales bacterium]|jgi:two-component system chemotaxis response regulator CheB|nr:chemotaxis-specific protein-glutamate methyltransferase CheB [Candidatus Saccharimonadales bacterium]